MKASVELGNGARSATLRARSAPGPARLAERRSWVIVYLAFLNWCLLVALGVAALLNYRATATEPQWAAVNVSGGLVSYQPSLSGEPRLITRERVDVLEGTVIQTEPSAEATLSLFDGSQVRLLGDARLSLQAMHTGKFEASGTQLGARLEAGPALFNVAGTLPGNGLVVDIGGAQTRLEKGQFLLWAEPTTARVLAYDGRASVAQPGKQVSLTSGQRAEWRARYDLSDPLPLAEDLLLNGDFSQGWRNWGTLDVLEVSNDALGQRGRVAVDIDGQAKVALRVTRDSPMDRHNKTGLIQIINRNVQGFRSLRLRASLRLLSANLDGGGYAGTEYPLTFVVYYRDERGGEPNWMHGFFYKNDENRPAQFGQRVAAGIWQDYEVDLMAQPDRPTFIKSVWVYGAGHDFDAMVTNLQLLAN